MEDGATRIAVLEERIRGLEKAIILQAEEYQRRLAELNHAHAQQVANQETYVSREVFEAHVKEEQLRMEDVKASISKFEGHAGGMVDAKTWFFQLVPMIISVGTLVVLFLHK